MNQNKKPQIIALHLPQFHEIPENNEWWGEGFTEWTNTKNSKPIFKGHHQPRTPLNNNWYDLSDVKAISRQMELAKKGEIGGFCYYHYWFNGKLLLEKPLELMRKLETRIPYFFCWANEPWMRTWDGTNEILIDQTYNGLEDWEKHYDYLRDFFIDEKYIKIDNKPVFVLYGTKNITDCDEMISYLDKRCKEDGYEGIYVIEEKTGFQNDACCSNSSGIMEFEPLFTLKYQRNFFEKTYDFIARKVFNRIHGSDNRIYSYDLIWKNILRRKNITYPGKSLSLGAFVDWDNTARKGNKSTFMYGATPKKFGKYIRRLFI